MEKGRIVAEADLAWWHGVMESALGRRGQGYEPGSVVAYDAEMIWALFERLHAPRRREAVRRWYQVAPAWRALPLAFRASARALYESRQWPPHLRVLWPVTDDGRESLTLVGLALRSEAATEAYAAAHGGEFGSWLDVLDFADRAARPNPKAPRQRAPRWVATALTQARAARLALLDAYAETRAAAVAP